MITPTTQSDWSKTVRERMAFVNQRGVPTGPVPLGYKKVRLRGQMWVVVDQETAPLVREAFQLAALKNFTLRQIVTIVSKAGLVSRRGTPLSATALWRILGNPFYLGQIRYSGKVLQGMHEPLITQSEFEKVQQSLSSSRMKQMSLRPS